jgi:uncharacterized protein YecE (DUF72 family)
MFEGDSQLHIGTSSWSSKDWVGPFYPSSIKPEAFIEYYSGVYDTVEIDATFYRMPTQKNVSSWKSRTPPGFTFAVKTPQIITHDKVLVDAWDDMQFFLDVIFGLEDRLGPILLQFPYFNKQAFSAPGAFFERLESFLSRLPSDRRFAVEVRNKTWLKDVHRICKSHGIALAWVEQAWMPKAAEWQKLLCGTGSDFAYIRFLGDHKAIEEKTTTWDKVCVDRSPEIEAWVPVIGDLRALQIEVFGYFNNHFAGHAPASLEMFRKAYAHRLGRVVGTDK